ncbi:MAG TPA: hypothetical protein VIN75_19295 [Burkholderiaceae bacterium]
MQVHEILAATLLAASAFGAMSQELDPGETLQAKNLSAPRLHIAPSNPRDLSHVIAAVRATESDAPATVAVADTSWASRHFKDRYARKWLRGDKRPATQVAAGQAG